MNLSITTLGLAGKIKRHHPNRKSYQSKAISYTQKLWPKLIRYLDNRQLNIDNNRAERAVKPFVIGRKAWLFANGAKASPALYSLVEMAKIKRLEPYHYLTQLLEQQPKANTPEALAKLLPY